MMSLEQELIEKIMQLDENRQRLVLEFIESLEHKDTSELHFTAQDLKRLPIEEQERIAQEALERSLGLNDDN